MDNSFDSAEFSAVPSPTVGTGEGRSAQRPVSFTIDLSRAASADTPASSSASKPVLQATNAPAHLAPFPVQAQLSHLPLLPRRKSPTFSRHRHDANPALAVKVLQDIQMAVEAWHQDLKQTVHRIQAVYMEGPIVDGWLETVDEHLGQAAALDAALLRHGDPQDLSSYVEQLCQSLESPQEQPATPGTNLGRPGYRLCSLDSDGRVQYFPCPPEQLSTISLAIARHQKLRQLLDHKQFLEAKLKRTVDIMTTSRDTLGIAPTYSSETGEE